LFITNAFLVNKKGGKNMPQTKNGPSEMERPFLIISEVKIAYKTVEFMLYRPLQVAGGSSYHIYSPTGAKKRRK
jgi:hypothetical protein